MASKAQIEIPNELDLFIVSEQMKQKEGESGTKESKKEWIIKLALLGKQVLELEEAGVEN